MNSYGFAMQSRVVLSVALFTFIVGEGYWTVYAQNIVAACLKNNGKIVKADDDDTPSKPCKESKQTEIMMVGADNVHIDGDNTAIGVDTFINNTIGEENTAYGFNALRENTEGSTNTAVGDNALRENTTGIANTGVGEDALRDNTTGGSNTAVGENALSSNESGFSNTAVGEDALQNSVNGTDNTVIGSEALVLNSSGSENSALGKDALRENTTGSGNTAIGFQAGQNATTGDDNIYVNHDGVTGESGTIRIGTDGTQTATFVAGINGVNVGGGGSAVFVNANGQLGTVASSRRFKQDIKDMNEASRGLMRLRPVTFRYKNPTNGSTRIQYGLIAEEVAEVYPDVVVHFKSGEVQSVQYHKINAMLLNELQQQHKQIQQLAARLARLEAKKAK